MGMLFPPQSNVLDTEVHTAERVAKLVFEGSLARVNPPKDISAWLRAMLYKPEYTALVAFSRKETIPMVTNTQQKIQN